MSRLGCGILGLERYEQAFRENEIHAEILPKLTANLGRVELVPHRLERAGGLDHVAFLKLGVLSCAVVTRSAVMVSATSSGAASKTPAPNLDLAAGTALVVPPFSSS